MDDYKLIIPTQYTRKDNPALSAVKLPNTRLIPTFNPDLRYMVYSKEPNNEDLWVVRYVPGLTYWWSVSEHHWVRALGRDIWDFAIVKGEALNILNFVETRDDLIDSG